MTDVTNRKKNETKPVDAEAFLAMAREGSLAARLSPEELEGLLAIGVRKKYARGTVVFHQGEEGDLAGFILSGAVKVSTIAGDGKEIAFAYLGPGDTAGEISVLDGRPRTASGVVVEPAEIIVISRRELLGFLSAHGDVALKVIEYLCDRLRQTNQLLESNRAHATEIRLARAVIRLLNEYGVEEKAGERMRFRLSQTDLGAFASVSRENVNRQLQEWAAQGFIALQQGQFFVKDREALEEIAEMEG